MNKCYRVDYMGNNDCDYIWCADDSSAIEQAMQMAKMGIDYVDAGHCDLELLQVVEVDDDSEFYDDLRIIWY